jgi:hypothetical protein
MWNETWRNNCRHNFKFSLVINSNILDSKPKTQKRLGGSWLCPWHGKSPVVLQRPMQWANNIPCLPEKAEIGAVESGMGFISVLTPAPFQWQWPSLKMEVGTCVTFKTNGSSVTLPARHSTKYKKRSHLCALYTGAMVWTQGLPSAKQVPDCLRHAT